MHSPEHLSLGILAVTPAGTQTKALTEPGPSFLGLTAFGNARHKEEGGVWKRE